MTEQNDASTPAAAPAEAARAPNAPQPRCPIVGIGASAGGLEAFEQFFTRMPPDSGMAFVLVQHLAPDHASLLPELLARYTTMPVRQITDGDPGRAQPRLRYPAECHADHHRQRPARRVPTRGAPRPAHAHRPFLPLPGRRPGRQRRLHHPLGHRHRRHPRPPGRQGIRRHGHGPDDGLRPL